MWQNQDWEPVKDWIIVQKYSCSHPQLQGRSTYAHPTDFGLGCVTWLWSLGGWSVPHHLLPLSLVIDLNWSMGY